MRVYEEYKSSAEKRKAQVGAKRGRPTGKARGYIFVYNENGMSPSGMYGAVSSVFEMKPGCNDPNGNLGGTIVSPDYLHRCCRKIGGIHLPPKWKERWIYYKTPEKD